MHTISVMDAIITIDTISVMGPKVVQEDNASHQRDGCCSERWGLSDALNQLEDRTHDQLVFGLRLVLGGFTTRASNIG